MKVMVVEEGEGALFFVCQALEALGVEIIRSPSPDEDKVLMYKIEAVIHIWSGFTAEIEMTRLRGLKEADPDLVLVIFAQPQDVPTLRRSFPNDLIAAVSAMEGPQAARAAQAMVQEVRKRKPPVSTQG